MKISELTNERKYRSTEARAKAWLRFCKKQKICEDCILHEKQPCVFAWLKLRSKAHIKQTKKAR